MELEQIVELIDRVSASELDSFCLEQNGMRLSLKKKQPRKQTDPETQSLCAAVKSHARRTVRTAASRYAKAIEIFRHSPERRCRTSRDPRASHALAPYNAGKVIV